MLEVPQPFKNHNGGHLAFGPDGYLYIGLGDGGSRGDPHGNAQDTTNLLGSILRIDVSSASSRHPYAIPPDNPFVGLGAGVREEIWAYGLRNPWRFSFDTVSGDLWAGDVGQGGYEEVNIIRPGLNYGWNIKEGLHCYQSSKKCPELNSEPPIVEYSHTAGKCSITGGYVYRGTSLPSLAGAYVYGDFCTGQIWAFRSDGAGVTEHSELLHADAEIYSFGQDQQGEIFVLLPTHIYRLEPGN